MASGPLVKNRNATFGTRLNGNSSTLGAMEALHMSSSSDMSCERTRGSTYSLNPNGDEDDDDHDGGDVGFGGGEDGCDGGKEKRENWVVSMFREKLLR